MKKLLASLLLLLFLPINGLAESYVSIRELYQETRTPWQVTYPFPNGETYAALHADYSFTVDLTPSVPDVERFPVLQLKVKPGDLTGQDLSIFPQATTALERKVEDVEHSLGRVMLNTGGFVAINPRAPFGRRHHDEMDTARDNPLTPDDAAAMAVGLWQKYLGVDNVRVRGVIGYDWEVTSMGEYASWDAARRKQVTLDQGVYTVVGEQVFAGVPLLESCFLYEDYGEFGVYYPQVGWCVDILDEKRFTLDGSAMEQVGVVYEDVPLLPFSRIREIYEQYLAANAGSSPLIHPLSAQLGYRLALAPGDPGDQFADNIYITRPVWIIRGYKPLPLFGSEKDRREEIAQEQLTLAHPRQMALGLESSYICIDAQTGEIIQKHLSDAVAQIVTWP